MPFFTTIIPSYNRAGFIGATIDSVLAQQDADNEIIVVDDGSKDDSLDVLARYGSAIKVIQQANAGPGAARNTGLAHATGVYTAFLDSDDLWFPWTLETYREAIHRHAEPAIVTAPCQRFTETLDVRAVPRLPLKTVAYPSFFESPLDWSIPSGFTVRTEVLAGVGGFAENIRVYEDVEVWLRLGSAPGLVTIVSPVGFGYRDHAAGISKSGPFKIRGINFLIRNEKAAHAGDDPRTQSRRREFICRQARPASLQCLQSGQVAEGASLYAQTLGWHLSQRRFRYIAGFPLKLLAATLRPGGRDSGADAA